VSQNVVGQSYALTVLTPIIAGHEIALRTYLRSLSDAGASPFREVPRTHFARWVIVPQPAFQGPPQRPDPWKSQYLIFTSCFDGDLLSYLGDLCAFIGPVVDAVWQHCVAYPGSDDPAAFARYMRHNQIDTEVYFASYPDATVQQVRDSLALRDRIVKFAIAAQGRSDPDIQSGWQEEFEQ
jgi:hypothetical protein